VLLLVTTRAACGDQGIRVAVTDVLARRRLGARAAARQCHPPAGPAVLAGEATRAARRGGGHSVGVGGEAADAASRVLSRRGGERLARRAGAPDAAARQSEEHGGAAGPGEDRTRSRTEEQLVQQTDVARQRTELVEVRSEREIVARRRRLWMRRHGP